MSDRASPPPHDSSNPPDQESPRAEAIIADIYGQVRAAFDTGAAASRVVMSREHYRLVQEYRGRLGDLADPSMDYIDRYTIFSLDIEIDAVATPRVE